MAAKEKNNLVPSLRFKEFNNNWTKKKLSDVSVITTGSTPSTSEDSFYNGEYLFVSPSDIGIERFITKTKTTLTQSGFEQGRKINKNSVLFVCIGSTIGKVGQAGKECITNQQINSLSSNKDNSNNFIYSLLELHGNKIKLLAGTQAVPQINKTDFSNFKFYFPSLPEQEKIAAFLGAVDEKIQQLTRKKQLLEQYKKGVMQQLFSGKLRFKDENGKSYPKWEEMRIGEVFENRNETGFNDMELLSVSINSGIYPQSESNKRDTSNNDKAKYKRVLKGDIAYNSMRMWQGASAVSNFNGIISPAYTILMGNKSNDSRYFGYLFKMPMMIQTFQKHSQGLTSDTWNLKYPMIAKIRIKRPSLEEQKKIANFLSSIDAKINKVAEALEATNQFKKGLLQQMFV